MNRIGIGTYQYNYVTQEMINDILLSGQISYGKYSKQFEQEFAELHNQKYGVLSNSGTSSLLVALQALKEYYYTPDGFEVIVPSITFVSTINIILQSNLKPVLVDIERDYYGIDCNKAKDAITNKTDYIIPVHTFGQPCDMPNINEISSIFGISVIEDSCEALGILCNHYPVGSTSHISCFSTYMAHIITTGVGGISLTSNEALAKIMRSLCNHGMDYQDLSNDNDYNPGKLHRNFDFIRVGHSFRITEFEAALGLAQLQELNKTLEKRRMNANVLNEELAKVCQGRLQLPKTRPNTEHAWQMYPIVCLDCNRDKLVRHLNQHNIETRLMLPITNQPVYKELFDPKDYPVANWINENGFYIGCHQGLSDEDLEQVIDAFEEFFNY